MKNSTLYLIGLIFLFNTGCMRDNMAPVKTIFNDPDFATGLLFPIGMVMDDKQNLWVTESGTGKNDGQLTLITPAGKKHVVAAEFPSMIRVPENIPVGLHHLIIRNDKVFFTHTDGKGGGYLYTLDISKYKIGDPPINASQLEKIDISSFIKSELNEEYSNPYDIICGPNQELYIVDAGANAIIKIDKTGVQSLVSEIPGIKNPLDFGPEDLESVPTGILWDGNKFLVTTLNGMPFPQGHARIMQMDLNGNVMEYKSGFNSLTDITLSPSKKLVVLEHGTFVRPPGPGTGWQANTGRLLLVGDSENIVLKDGLTAPTAVVSSGNGFYYVNSFRNGTILKLKTIGT